MSVLRCSHCRIIVDVAGPASTGRCACCGRSLTAMTAPEAEVWDDAPTERRPTDYYDQLVARSRR